MDTAKNKTILLGICGGVAAYKALEVASALRQHGHDIHTIMSPSAQKFITPLSFQSITGNPVLTQQFPDTQPTNAQATYPHLYPATQAHAFILLPATANKIAQLTQGLGIDTLTTAALSLPPTCIRLYCPSMNIEMWEQPTLQKNTLTLQALGWQQIGPQSGHLACGMTGQGRLAPPATITNTCLQRLQNAQSLSGKTIMILSGPTREHLDPIRYIGNPSSGKMGKALALAAAQRGAHVTFITGPIDPHNLPQAPNITHHHITSANDMLHAAQTHSPNADLWIFAAAIADYSPLKKHHQKRPKQKENITLTLKNTPDIAATLAPTKTPKQKSIGFALQTQNGDTQARNKLKNKNLDAIILNHLDALAGDTGTYQYITQNNPTENWGTLPKTTCANHILDQAHTLLTPHKDTP